MVRVKICGITNLRDAGEAVRCGADALGFVFAESPRRVAPRQAAGIIRAVGPWAATVGVFVNEEPQKVLRIARTCGLSAVQLHGEESRRDEERLAQLRVIRAFRVGPGFSFSLLRAHRADAFLFDTRVEGRYGGTGKRFDRNMLADRKFKRPFILSGGLTPLNVREAVRVLRPYGVDVSSGVEKSPGVKDRRLLKEFIDRAKSI